mgnify:FL=1
MAILYYDEKKLFQLNTENTTYVIGLSRKATSDMFTMDPFCTESRICIRSAWMSRRSPRPSIRERNLRSSTVFQWNTRPEESAITVRAV